MDVGFGDAITPGATQPGSDCRRGGRVQRAAPDGARALARHQSANRAADSLKVSRTKYYELRRGNPLVGSINTITDAELAECRKKFGGDVLKMADALKVSPKALKDRLAQRKQ